MKSLSAMAIGRLPPLPISARVAMDSISSYKDSVYGGVDYAWAVGTPGRQIQKADSYPHSTRDTIVSARDEPHFQRGSDVLVTAPTSGMLAVGVGSVMSADRVPQPLQVFQDVDILIQRRPGVTQMSFITGQAQNVPDKAQPDQGSALMQWSKLNQIWTQAIARTIAEIGRVAQNVMDRWVEPLARLAGRLVDKAYTSAVSPLLEFGGRWAQKIEALLKRLF